MLVLTRKTNEGILVGDEIKVTVISIEGDRVRLGIEAPQNIRGNQGRAYHGDRK